MYGLPSVKINSDDKKSNLENSDEQMPDSQEYIDTNSYSDTKPIIKPGTWIKKENLGSPNLSQDEISQTASGKSSYKSLNSEYGMDYKPDFIKSEANSASENDEFYDISFPGEKGKKKAISTKSKTTVKKEPVIKGDSANSSNARPTRKYTRLTRSSDIESGESSAGEKTKISDFFGADKSKPRRVVQSSKGQAAKKSAAEKQGLPPKGNQNKAMPLVFRSSSMNSVMSEDDDDDDVSKYIADMIKDESENGFSNADFDVSTIGKTTISLKTDTIKASDNCDHRADKKYGNSDNLSVKPAPNRAISISNNQRKNANSLKSAPIVICESSSESEIPVTGAKALDDSGSGEDYGASNNNDGINAFVISADENEFISMPSVRATRSQKAS
ncbi:hypothetical protein AYI69_g5625, partial [Smittium culicis]